MDKQVLGQTAGAKATTDEVDAVKGTAEASLRTGARPRGTGEDEAAATIIDANRTSPGSITVAAPRSLRPEPRDLTDGTHRGATTPPERADAQSAKRRRYFPELENVHNKHRGG